MTGKSRHRSGKGQSQPRVVTGEVLPPLWLTLWPFGDRPLPAALRASRRAGLAIAAAVGIAAGAIAAALSGTLSFADAASRRAAALDLRDAPIVAPNAAGKDGAGRSAAIERLLSAGAPERFDGDLVPSRRAPPRIVVVFDDVGIDRRGFDTLMALPGPLTLSFLPYANEVQAMADAARARGHAILLHLPMEPSGGADPGPGALTASMSNSELFAALGANLAQFDGYSGVNNHMGSKLTRDEQAMKRILAFLDSRALFFLDSLTTGKSVASAAGNAVGAEVLVRDLFLDAEPGRQAVRRQLALAEKIAAETGYVIAIAHPRADTLAEIGPWLTSAPARGFRLETITGLRGARSGAYAANAADARLR
ncbi:MAG: divergent polysaccharide deacetylase family protein [Parvularculaceae bacterium]